MAATANGAEMDEDVLPAVALDEAVALVDVEPLDLADLAVVVLDLGDVDQLRGQGIDRQGGDEQQHEDGRGRRHVDHGDTADREAGEEAASQVATGEMNEQSDQQRRRRGQQQADQRATKDNLAIHGMAMLTSDGEITRQESR